jgi:hypothetical protein
MRGTEFAPLAEIGGFHAPTTLHNNRQFKQEDKR